MFANPKPGQTVKIEVTRIRLNSLMGVLKRAICSLEMFKGAGIANDWFAGYSKRNLNAIELAIHESETILKFLQTNDTVTSALQSKPLPATTKLPREIPELPYSYRVMLRDLRAVLARELLRRRKIARKEKPS